MKTIKDVLIEMETKKDLMDWYEGPLTKERIAELRFKLAKARGLLMSFCDPNPKYHPTVNEVKQILKETEDP